MNIFKLIANWLIHLLGGVTIEEYEKAEEPWYTVAADYHDQYNAEHEAYLALLNCHNATAEAAQNGTSGVSGAIDTIKAYCKSKGSCDECALYNKNSGCKILEIPCYWGE